MARQKVGRWGLQPLNVRLGLARNHDYRIHIIQHFTHWFSNFLCRFLFRCRTHSNNVASLGYFFEEEKRVVDEYRRKNQSPTTTFYGPNEFALTRPDLEPNSLFVNGSVAPPRTSSSHDAADDNNHGVPVLFSCMCGQPSL
ncbi:ankyrin repeat family protein [Hibiscus syriacus]|uniref:Ankyrin repeat family protein n=1 Tax=Hibiscus syriacus TaxID=106335 RepID=A0A6A2ZZ78_HIBSY|nr:ankyrin repeat family protein [Hibiscus syriacus]